MIRKPDPAASENPLSVLPLGSRIRRENFLVGFTPWVGLVLIEWTVLNLAWMGRDIHLLMNMLFLEFFVLPPVMGYVGQLHGIRTFENLWRRVRYEDVAVTLINESDIYDWIDRSRQRLARRGIVLNLILAKIPIVGACYLIQPEQTRLYATAVLLVITILGLMGVLYVLRIALSLAVIRLFRTNDYFVGRALSLWDVSRWWLKWVLLVGMGGVGFLPLDIFQDYPLLVVMMFPLGWFFMRRFAKPDETETALREEAIAAMGADDPW